MASAAVHHIVILILMSVLIASVRSQEEPTVLCRVSEDCDEAPGDDRLGNLTPRQCCVENPEGRAFTVNGTCTPCTVFGFFTDSFTDEEQGEAYTVQVGYLKRPANSQAGNLRFNVINTPGSATEGVEFDYSVSTNSVPAVMDGSTRDVTFQFRTDSIAQEPDETFSLELVPGSGVTLPAGEGVFFLNVVNMTIIDGDVVNVMFSEDDFRATEAEPSVPVLVTKTSRIATPIVLQVRPLTVQEANMTDPPLLPPNVPPENRVSPPFANLQDFDNTIISITFEPDESGARNEIRTPISIVDDAINEATEQVFVVQLHLIESESPEKVILTERPASLCRIVDNDPIRIGFELPQYTFMEPMFETQIDINFEPDSGLPVNGPVYLAKENITSEQTFQVIFQVLESIPPTSTRTIEPATIDEDYLFAGRDLFVSRIFPPNRQSIDFVFSLLADNLPEETESFRVLAQSGGQDIEGELSFPQFSSPEELSTDTFVIIEDDDIIQITIGFEETEYFVNETQFLEVYVRVFDPPENEVLPIEVNLVIQTLPGSATGGEDYREIIANNFDVFLIFDDANRRRSFRVQTFGDNLLEGDETFVMELRFDPFLSMPPEGVTLLPDVSTVTIVDVGPLDMVNVSFEQESYTVHDGDGSVEICFTTNTGHAEAIEVEVLPTEKPGIPDDMKATVANDFVGGVQRQTFEASDSGDRRCVNIVIINDILTNELDQLFLVTFANLPDTEAGVLVGPIAQACVTILDDDEPIFSIGPNITVNESTPLVEICVTTSSSFARDLVITAVTGPKSGALNQATGDLDYTHTTLMFTFGPQDEGSQTDCDFVEIIDDQLGNEPDEEFSVTLINVIASGSEEACITIIDNDTPEVEWEIPETTIPEGENREVCFTTDIGTAVPYQVEIGARMKGTNPATGSDYTFQPQVITIPASSSGSRFCVDVRAISDTDVEGVEQFELYFENLPSAFADVGEIDTVCVNITDSITPPDFLMCEITEPQRVRPFSLSMMYGFMGPCEHIAFSSCQPVDGNDVRVTVDFLTNSLENGAVGLHVGDFRYVSREDGSFDDGGQLPISVSITGTILYAPTPNSQVFVDRGDRVTSIMYTVTDVSISDPSFILINITHTHGAEEDASIAINVQTPTGSEIQDFCGLCGNRNGDLLKRDGSIANINNMAEVQNFAQCNLVEPRDQILRPQRRECGTIRNDTVIGDPLYAAPVYSEDGKEYSLCYEVYGRTNSTLNLVSDTCVNVNARYGPMNNPVDGNIINAIGVRAKGLSDNSCYNIRVDLDGCSAEIDSADGLAVLDNMQSFEQDGISVRKYPRRVRIAAPNCENVMMVMWVICESRSNDQDMIKFVVARGVNLRASSHGLLGQFWNIPVTFAKFTGNLPSFIEAPENYYVVTVVPESSPPRRFLGEFHTQKWDFSSGPCLYVGNAQGGPSFEVEDPNDSVIEGYYREYIIEGGDLFETEYKYNQFEEERC